MKNMHVEVYLSFAKYSNIEPPKLASLAKKHDMKRDGGGMWLGSKDYGHGYNGREKDARAFARAVRKLGFDPEVV